MKTIQQIWTEIETELAEGDRGEARPGLLTRLATSDAGQTLRVGIEWPSFARVLLFSAPAGSLPPRAAWPECRGLDLFLETQTATHTSLVVRLRERQMQDVFSVLAEDLARRTLGCSEVEAARRVLAAFGRWQRFLATMGRTLSEEARRGLWGELWVLGNVLTPLLGVEAAVMSWRGPAGAPQDFQFETNAVEVKTRASRSPAVVRISGEQQLYAAPWANLFLTHLSVDEQDGSGETLPERVSALRHLASGTSACEILEDALLEAGWLDSESEKHLVRGFILRSVEYFRVTDSFPCLVPTGLPAGIGGVVYDLSIDAARVFSVEPDAVTSAFKP